ncbi:hypothetical protein ACFV6F_18995 [Kitasatospora phosalacinea]|uniref:hypothetical protein n=1 Tax=Kitasatospora phosalacinea TaxID=2065 RepID=UPI003660F755
MFQPSAWATPCVAVSALLVVLGLARYLAGSHGRTAAPTGRHRAGAARTQAPPPPPPPPVRAPNTLPVCSRFRHPLSLHALRRTIMPRLPLVHGPATRIAVRTAPRPAVRPGVVPPRPGRAPVAPAAAPGGAVGRPAGCHFTMLLPMLGSTKSWIRPLASRTRGRKTR